MSDRSAIEWTDATWNPVRGCTKISPGCTHCYAETFAERFRGVLGHPYEQGFDLRLVPEKLTEPLRWSGPRTVFVNSMSDLFHEDVPDEYILAVAAVMRATPWHTYQVLTKRAQRLHLLLNGSLGFAAALTNVWWGVSVENRKHGLPRVEHLQAAQAALRFLSIEPLLEELGAVPLDGIHWVIVGGESGHGARPMYYIDGFAGAGQYTDPPEPGSPVIAARLAAEAPANRRPYTLRCINVEPDTFDDLVAATTGIAPGLVENRKGTFREHLPEILSIIGSSPALFFLDPYGHSGMEWDVVSQLAQRSQVGRTTEVLLNFFISKIDRDGGWIDSVHKAGPAFVRHLDDLFGTTDWQGLYTTNKDQGRRMHALTMLYLERLARAFNGIAATFEVKTIQGALKYHIIHGTHASIGCREMSDVVYRVSEEYRHEQADVIAAATVQLPLFSSTAPTEEERNAAITRALAPDIHALTTKRSRLAFTDIQDELMGQWFGRALERHYRAACKLLIADKKAELVRTATTSPRSRGGIKADTVIQLL